MAGLLVGARAEAASIPFSDALAPGFSLSIGGLTFSEFVVGTALGVDVNDFDIDFFTVGDEAGFRLTGPTVATAGALAFLSFAYEVETVDPGAGISEAILFSNLDAVGAGSVASVEEALRALPGLAPVGALQASDTGGAPDLGGSLLLATLPAALRVDTSLVAASGATGAALVTLVEQRFALSVSEPGALLLLASGALGIALLGSRSRRPRARSR